jgi:alcohol dehydrogenase (cytochrome c)
MAYADGELFVPAVDLWMTGSAYGYESLARVNVAARGRGELVALDATRGSTLWTHRFPQPDFGCATVADGVVFTSTFDGSLYALDTATGATLWKSLLSAGVNSCPALSGNILLVGAGIPRHGAVGELEALTTGAAG